MTKINTKYTLTNREEEILLDLINNCDRTREYTSEIDIIYEKVKKILELQNKLDEIFHKD